MMSHIRQEETKAQKVYHSNSRSKIQLGSADLRPQVLSIIPTVLKPYCAADCWTPPQSFWFCRSRVGLEKSAFLTVPRWCCWFADHTWRTTELHQTFFDGRELPWRMKQLYLWQKGGQGGNGERNGQSKCYQLHLPLFLTYKETVSVKLNILSKTSIPLYQGRGSGKGS